MLKSSIAIFRRKVKANTIVTAYIEITGYP
jgi:hypothetical protein